MVNIDKSLQWIRESQDGAFTILMWEISKDDLISELKHKLALISNIKKNTNKCWQSIKDQDICDIEDIFFNKLKSLGIKLNVKDKHKIIRLAKDVAIVSFYFKEKYKRPRPFKLSKFYGMKIDNVGKTTDSPSYPSSHATVGKFLALYLADKFPEHKKQIMKTGIEIGENRVKAGFHFPSDVKIGFYLAEKLWENLNDNK